MLNFDEPRYLGIQAGAVGLAARIRSVVQDRLDAGAKNIVFMGAGGVGTLMEPAAALLRTRSTLPVHTIMPAGFSRRKTRMSRSSSASSYRVLPICTVKGLPSTPS